jgi:hypothetical protein
MNGGTQKEKESCGAQDSVCMSSAASFIKTELPITDADPVTK